MKEIWSKKASEDHGKSPTVFAAFKKDLYSLTDTLKTCDMVFVRCIKPNRAKVPLVYESDLVLTQLAYTGMLTTLVIQKTGYASRIPHQQYVDDYRCLGPDQAKEGCQALVDHINETYMPAAKEVVAKSINEQFKDQLEKVAIICGKDQFVLSRDWAQTQVEIEANRVKGESAIIIQAQVRATQNMHDYQGRVSAVAELGPMFRSTMARLDYYQKKWVHVQEHGRSELSKVTGTRITYLCL